jgi:hypothetical protein
MSHLRTISTRRIIAICIAAVLGLAGLATIAVAASENGAVPPPKPLAQAVHDAMTGAAPDGVTARVTFTNKLIDASGVGQGRNPLLAGATGRLWVASSGDLRLELQSQGGGGNAQIVLRGDRLTVLDSASNTLYRATLPPAPADATSGGAPETPPTLAVVERALGRLAQSATVGEATPANIAGREAYTVRLAPRSDGGLVGGASVAWDAANGAPLRAAVYAAGRNDPVLELVATDVAFGAVDPSVFDVASPPDAKVVDLSPAQDRPTDGGAPAPPVTGLDAVRAKVGFPLSAPATLAGMDRAQVALVQRDGREGALVTYGKGLGGIAVLQTPEPAGAATGSGLPAGRDGGLPTVDLGGGVQGTALETALGTALTFTRDGVRFVVIGSVTADVAKAAARGL